MTSKCDWSPEHKFVICDQGGITEGKLFSALSIYGYSASKKRYVFYGLDEGGAPFPMRLVIDGKTWSYLADVAKPGEKQWKTTNEFMSPTEIVFKVWSSTDGEHWTLSKSGREKKQQP